MLQRQENDASTRERVLVAASEIFADKGFRRTTVREIVGRARVNLNAVNYHFGDKQGLYEAVIEWAHQNMDEDQDLVLARDTGPEAEERLAAFVRAFIRRALLRQPAPYISRLMAMEMGEPTGALDMVVERFIRPRFALMCEIIRQIVGDQLPQEKVELCAQSIVGQCIHLVHGRSIITRLIPRLHYSQKDIDELASHVTQFSVAALKALSSSAGDSE